MSEETILFSDGIPYPDMTYDVTGRVKNEYNNLRLSSRDDLDAGITRYMNEVGDLIIDILCVYGNVNREESKSLIDKHLKAFLSAEIGDCGIVSGKSGKVISSVINMYHAYYFRAGITEDELKSRMKNCAKEFKKQTEELFKDISKKRIIPVHEAKNEKEVDAKIIIENNINKAVNKLKDLPSYISEVSVPLEDIEFDGDKMILKCGNLEAVLIADELLRGTHSGRKEDDDTIFDDDYDEISKTLEEILEDLSREDE